MNRTKIVAGNWKMNLLHEEAIELATELVKKSGDVRGVTRLVFPPFPYIQAIATILKKETDFYCGGQNCSQFATGAYTGEVSAAILKSIGAGYVLIGHSERRSYFNESSETLVLKMKQALENNLRIIFCFGEQLTDRKSNNHFSTVQKQLEEVFCEFPEEKLSQLILAYEPVWAIGTGETASPKQAQEMHAFVRKALAGIFSLEFAQNISILYGGSCNAQNAKELFSCADVDGGLIGGASLKADEFNKILHSF